MSENTNQEWRFYDDPNSVADLFCALDANQFSALASRAKTIKVAGNVRVRADHAPAQAVFLLKTGRAGLVNCGFRSVLNGPNGSRPFFFLIETLTEGSCEGELRTTTGCVFAVVERADLNQFLLDQPEVCFDLTRAVSQLYQITIRQIAENRTI